MKFFHNQSGGVSIFVAISVLTLLLTAASAIETGRFVVAKSRAVTIFDGALLAATEKLNETTGTNTKKEQFLKNIMKQYISSNLAIDSLGGTITINTGPTIIKNANGDISINATGNSNVPMVFGSLLNSNGWNIALRSQTTRALSLKNLEISLILDHSASMASNANIIKLKNAVTLFINKTQNIINKAPNNEKPKIAYSLVPFSEGVNVKTLCYEGSTYSPSTCPADTANPYSHPKYKATANSIATANAWEAYYAANFASSIAILTPYAKALDKVKGLTENVSFLKNKLNNTGLSWGTNAAAGMLWGWRTLKAGSPLLSSEQDVIPVAITDPNTRKIAILFSDGSNDTIKHKQNQATPKTNAFLDSIQIKICNAMKLENIEIFTIGFTNSPTNFNWAPLKSCASNANNFAKASNSSDLNRAFSRIADTLSKIVLSK